MSMCTLVPMEYFPDCTFLHNPITYFSISSINRQSLSTTHIPRLCYINNKTGEAWQQPGGDDAGVYDDDDDDDDDGGDDTDGGEYAAAAKFIIICS